MAIKHVLFKTFLVLLAGFLLFSSNLVGLSSLAANDLTLKAVQHIEAAEQFMRYKQWSDANAEWRAALELYPKDPKVVRGLTTSLMSSKYYGEAVELLQNSIKTDPDQVQFRVLLADIYIFLNEPERSFSLLKSTLKKFPNDQKLLEVLQKVTPHLKGDQKREALYLAQKAHAKHLKQAREATRQLDFEAARDYYALATVGKSSTESLNDYALACLLTGHYREAQSIYKRVVKEHPDGLDYKILSNAGLASLSAGQHFQARQYLEKAIALVPEEPILAQLYNNLGYFYEQSNRSLQAQFAYKKATELAEDYTLAHKNLAFAYLNNMEVNQAISTYRNLIRQHPNDAELWNLLGYAYEQKKDERRAIGAYKKAIRLAPDEQTGYLNLGNLYQNIGNIKEASKAFEKMMAIKFKALESGKTSQENSSKPKAPLSEGPQRLAQYVELYFLN